MMIRFLQVHAYYNFRPETAYLSVNYMDCFLASHTLPVIIIASVNFRTPQPRTEDHNVWCCLLLCAARERVAAAAIIRCLLGPGSKNGRNKRAPSVRPAGEGNQILVQAQDRSKDGALSHVQSQVAIAQDYPF